MAQTRLEAMLMKVSKRKGDEVQTPWANGGTISAAMRLNAINNARKIVYKNMLPDIQELRLFKKLMQNFRELYPEFFVKEQKTVTSSSITKSANMRKVITVFLKGGINKECREIFPEVLFQATNEPHSPHYASATYPKYYEEGSSIKIYGISIPTGTADVISLIQPLDLVQGGADMTEPELWDDDILDVAVDILHKDQQLK